MAPVPAVSLESLVGDVGSYAGIAAILGLAVLSLLYFAQAREVKRLRDWAGRSPERAQELEQRVTAHAEESRRVAATPAAGGPGPASQSPPSPVTPAAARSGEAPAPHAPAGAELTTVQRPAAQPAASRPAPVAAPPNLAAPALGSATPGPALFAGVAAVATAQAEPAASSGAAAPAATPEPTPEPVAPPEAAPAPQRVQAAPAASTAAAATRVVAPPGRPATAGNGRGDSDAPRQPERRTVAIGGRRDERLLPDDATIPPRRASAGRPPAEGASRRRTILLAGAGLLLVAAIAFAAIEITSNSGEKGATKPVAKAKAKRGGTKGGAFSRGSVTVAVLNGTPTAGLANQVATELVREGFGRGAVTNAQDQQRSATVVSYLPGHRAAATEVARALRVPAAVEPVDPDTRAVACPPPAACNATVIVTVGADRTG